MIIRAVTLHAPTLGSLDMMREKVLEKKNHVREEVFSWRIVLPFFRNYRNIAELVDDVKKDFGREWMVAVPFGSIEKRLFDEASALLSSGTFVSFEVKSIDELEYLAEFLFKTYDEGGWLSQTRFSAVFGSTPQTPYFPATASYREGVSISVLYPSDLMKSGSRGNIARVFKDLFKQVFEKARAIGKVLETPLLGVDYSLSPWMEESVARVIEEIKGSSLTLPGSLSTILMLNRLIKEASSDLQPLGFNEVMLPLAEDNRLKDLAEIGDLTLLHLVHYTNACVAGLDMVPLPESTEKFLLENLLRDLYAIHLIKKRVMGVRLILTDVPPGEEIDLGIFGKTPVLDIKY